MAVPVHPTILALYGRRHADLFVDTGTILDLDGQVDALLREPGWNPPLLPDVGRALLAASQRGRFDITGAHAALAVDPLVTARIAQRAQREAGKRRTIATLHDVVDVLGTDGVARMVYEMVCQGRVFRAPGYLDAAIVARRRALATATVSGMLAELIPHAALSPADAWTRSFLSDVGLQMALVALGSARSAPPVASAWSVCVEAHARLGGRVLRAWGLTDALAEAPALLHDPSPTPAATLLQLAEALVQDLDGGAEGDFPYAGAGTNAAYLAAEHILAVHVTAIGALREDARGALQRQGLLNRAPRARATG